MLDAYIGIILYAVNGAAFVDVGKGVTKEAPAEETVPSNGFAGVLAAFQGMSKVSMHAQGAVLCCKFAKLPVSLALMCSLFVSVNLILLDKSASTAAGSFAPGCCCTLAAATVGVICVSNWCVKIGVSEKQHGAP